MWKLMQMKNKLLRKHKRSPNDARTLELLKHINKKLNSAKQIAKTIFYRSLFSDGNTKKMWHNINKLLGKHQNHKRNFSIKVNDHSCQPCTFQKDQLMQAW